MSPPDRSFCARHWLMELMVELRKAGKTLITTTHDIFLVKKIASRVIVLGENHGIIAYVMPAQVIADHELLRQANITHEHETNALGYSRQPEWTIHGDNIIDFSSAAVHRNN